MTASQTLSSSWVCCSEWLSESLFDHHTVHAPFQHRIISDGTASFTALVMVVNCNCRFLYWYNSTKSLFLMLLEFIGYYCWSVCNGVLHCLSSAAESCLSIESRCGCCWSYLFLPLVSFVFMCRVVVIQALVLVVAAVACC